MVHDRATGDLPARTLYEILQLRSAVFVVEQRCLYLDPDGRDLEPGARQLWITDADGAVVATARVLDDGELRRIGRIATAAHARGQGLAAALVSHVVARYPGPWVLHAQAHLADWYRRLGFEVTGPAFDDDGIPHVPMRRDP